MNRDIANLCLLSGGGPRFGRPLHVGQPNLGDRQSLIRRVEELVDRVWLTNDGPFNREFEARVAEMVGVKHCVAMCNATVALEIMIRAGGLSGEVIVPSFTFVATAHALQWQAITPVFCDIDPNTQTLDPARVAELITPRTSGIIGVHLWGRPCAVDALAKLAARHHLALFYDAAHAFGCTANGSMLGQFGHAEVFSFHATKFVQCGEGGAVVTNDDHLAEKMRYMRNFGFHGYDRVVHLGTNGKLSELCAAMGLTSLDKMDHFVATNRQNYEAYVAALAGLPGISLLPYDHRERNNYQYIVLVIDNAACPLTRDQLLQVLHSENVLARRYFFPGAHAMEPYRSLRSPGAPQLPVTEQIAQSVLVLPTGTAVGAREIAEMGEIFRAALAAAPQLRTRLPATLSVAQGMSTEAILSQAAGT